MLFSSMGFIAFFLPMLIFFYFIVPKKHRAIRNIVLLVFSLIFYAYGGPKFLLLMFLSVFINYVGGLFVDDTHTKLIRKSAAVITIVLNLSLIGWFKYAGFFSEIINSVFVNFPIFNVVLPIGISFYTFQSLSYVIDVYRGETKVQRNPLKLMLYISLFPQLIAGPIVRYSTIAEEIDNRNENVYEFSEGLVRFMFGFAKKMILANAAAEIANSVFSVQPYNLTASLAWIGALAYAFQIYFDFSAYSDMAIGLGRMFGFHFHENFNYPYIAKSITEFWHRWHISLSTWFRDYVYIPLGGNRCKPWKHVRNIIIVWALTGLWHGAAWNFILWGLWFCLLLLLEKYLLANVLKRLPSGMAHFYTLFMVIISWVLFRATNLEYAVDFIKAMFGHYGVGFKTPQTAYLLIQYWPEWIFFFLASTPIAKYIRGTIFKPIDSNPESRLFFWSRNLLALFVFGLGYIKLVSGSFNPFIYFRF